MRDYAQALGLRLRAIRLQQGLSLQAVQERSGGEWKAVVVGSYERGDRAISVQRLADLAAFYRVPVTQLLPAAVNAAGSDVPRPADGSGDTPASSRTGGDRLVLNLGRLASLQTDGEEPETARLGRYVAAIQAQRGDYNGRVLTLRHEDLRALALLYDTAPALLIEQLAQWGVLGDG